jgi:hypothetical protein
LNGKEENNHDNGDNGIEEQEKTKLILYKNYHAPRELCSPRTTPKLDLERQSHEPGDTLKYREAEMIPKPPPKPEPPSINQLKGQTVAKQLLTMTWGDNGLDPSKALHYETSLQALKTCWENCIPAHDPNSQPDEEPNGIEESDQIVNPKAPSIPPTSLMVVPVWEVMLIATRIWGQFRDFAILILIGRSKIGQSVCYTSFCRGVGTI